MKRRCGAEELQKIGQSPWLKLRITAPVQHKGRTKISKRGKRKLGKILYQVMVPLLARNEEFRTIYDYYVTHVKNPLKRIQAMVAVSCNCIYSCAFNLISINQEDCIPNESHLVGVKNNKIAILISVN